VFTVKVNKFSNLASDLMQATRTPAYFKTMDALLFVKELTAAKAVSREVL
tara:strand:+ start:1527 stop:1676 length:150 start_codon:yes stop_codon:yes gene_type:complete